MAHSVAALDRTHDVSGFDCGVPALNSWLQTVASQHKRKLLSMTFVLVDDAAPAVIIGFYALAIRGMTATESLPSEIARKLPLNVPGMTLARLAVDKKSHGQGCGGLLLVDAMTRVRAVAGQVGGYALFVDAKDMAAARFYSRYGFKAVPSDPLLLCIPIASIPAIVPE